MYPLLLSAPRTTHFFVRHVDDNFDIDLERVNASGYSPLKLHRVSFFLDVGHESGSPMGFGYDGTMLVSASQRLQTADQAADLFNLVKACLALGGLVMDATTASMIGLGELRDTGYFRYHRSHGAEAEIARAFQEGGAGSLLNIRLMNAPRITEDEVVSAYHTGVQLLQKLTNLDPAFFIQAATCLPNRETRSCLIFGWVACEQIVEQIWSDIFLSDETFYLTDYRRANLKKLNNVAQKLDTLFQAEIIDEQTYEHAFYARKARNDFAHRGGAVTYENAARCVSALIGLIATVAKHHGLAFAGGDNIQAYATSAGRYRASTVTTAADMHASDIQPTAWRSLFQIPGDDAWEAGEEKVDGHRIGPVVGDAKGVS